MVEALQRDLDELQMRSRAAERSPSAEAFAFPLGIGALLGQRTAELHKALRRRRPTIRPSPSSRCERRTSKQWSDEVGRGGRPPCSTRLEDGAARCRRTSAEDVAALVGARGAILKQRLARVARR